MHRATRHMRQGLSTWRNSPEPGGATLTDVTPVFQTSLGLSKANTSSKIESKFSQQRREADVADGSVLSNVVIGVHGALFDSANADQNLLCP